MQRMLHDLRHALRSPSRNPRMATVLGRLLGIAFLACFVTGILSHYLQEPLQWMVFATRPVWLYQISQAIHITAGILCFPLILGKLHVIYPSLFQTPPVRSIGHFLERGSIALLVAASLVQITIGLLNTYQLYFLFPFPFRQTHWALSFVVMAALAIHIGVKLPIIARYWRKKDSYDDDGTVIPLDDATDRSQNPERPEGATIPDLREPETTGVTGRLFRWIDRAPLADVSAGQARTSRRGFLATIGVAATALFVTTGGQSFRALDATNLFGPRKQGVGPNALPVNRTAQAAGVEESAMAPDWTLTVSNGETSRVFTRAELEALPQFEVDLPIACVEGWSQVASWKGPRMKDLADAVGAPVSAAFRATSLEQKGNYAVMEMGPEYVRDELTLVALELNGAPLDIQHGYPARMIAPARPGVLQTKWLSTLEVIA
ncbi:molybdopterin-dependent oxidoreductase [Mycetocola sp. CAN_C7]|uniref:molybdopterin-dependent oxidoreductase n=1 Tax=Mycetocola sp. CAN_C7 TaxID=2787724 RepID=UPI0018C9DDDB